MCNVNIKLVDEKRTGQVTIDEQHSNTILSDVKADLLNEVIVMTPSNCKKNDCAIQTKKKGKLNFKMPVTCTSLKKKSNLQKTRNIQNVSKRYLKTNLSTRQRCVRLLKQRHFLKDKQKSNSQITKEHKLVQAPIIVSNITSNQNDSNEMQITGKTIIMDSNESAIKKRNLCTSEPIKLIKSKNSLFTGPRSNIGSNQNNTVTATAISVSDVNEPRFCDKKVEELSSVNKCTSDACCHSEINCQKMNEALLKFNFNSTYSSPEFFVQYFDFDAKKMLNHSSKTDICPEVVKSTDECSQTLGDELQKNVKPIVKVRKKEGECSSPLK